MKTQCIGKQNSILNNRKQVENMWILVKSLFFLVMLCSIFISGPFLLSSAQYLLSNALNNSLSPIIYNGVITSKYLSSKLKNNHEQFVYESSSFIVLKSFELNNSKKIAIYEQASDYHRKNSIALIEEDTQKIIIIPSWVALKNSKEPS